jgi:perosamine synthetase
MMSPHTTNVTSPEGTALLGEEEKPGRFYPVAAPVLGTLEEEYVLDAVRSGWVSSLGRYIGEFESQFAAYCECRHGVATSNGTTALHLALVCIGVGPGDEVILPSLTFVATANAVAYTGATPVFVDSEPETWCVDPVAVERALSPSTTAILVVHLYGHPADMEPILALAARRGIPVIEDAAEAHGAVYKGRRVGSLGSLGIFSFYGNKLITTGEGGMLVTNDEDLVERARFLRDHGMSKTRRYWHTEVGYNYRLTNLQAALGLAQLQRIEVFLVRKREIVGWYAEALRATNRICLNPDLSWARSAFWLACALLPARGARERVMAELFRRGVDTRPFFHPMHTLPPYSRGTRSVGRDGEGCPIAEDLGARGINLPSAVNLEREDVLHIGAALQASIDGVLGNR